ncbi:MAG: arginine--tRNA ligase, partial [Desulfurococcales archaeon]|nr:arginine--tRNA ligase [Desulfurococcales archaeon]
NWVELAAKLAEDLRAKDLFLKDVKSAGVYLNFFVKYPDYSKKVLTSVKELGEGYGRPVIWEGKRIVVEYVSANPVHPLHIGSGRNAVLGDFIYRILKFSGAEVQRRYYVDDVGLQVAYLGYGYIKLGKPNPPAGMKPDHYYGLIYAATTTIIDILKLKKELDVKKSSGNNERVLELSRQIDELMSDLARIKEKIPEEIDALLNALSRVEDPESEVNELMRKYEAGDKDSEPVREVASKVVEGIRKTLESLGIEMDVWDWESDLIRSGMVDKVLREARESLHFTEHKGVPALQFEGLLKDPALRKKLRIPEGLDIPPLILVRKNGSTLYTTRDIAYTLKKFREFDADLVINVIAVEQTLPQAQLRLALHALGHAREAESLIHYKYEMVNLPGTSMSGRRGRYVTVDEVLEKMTTLVQELMKGKKSEAGDKALKIARSAFKYMMLSASPSKTLVFDLRKALDTNQLSGPYLQYTYARANSVLEKAGEVEWDTVDFSATSQGLRRRLIWLIGKFPSVMSKVASELHPEDLVHFLNEVADAFNAWYDKEPILKEGDRGVRALKLAITASVKTVLGTGMSVLGLDVLRRI